MVVLGCSWTEMTLDKGQSALRDSHFLTSSKPGEERLRVYVAIGPTPRESRYFNFLFREKEKFEPRYWRNPCDSPSRREG